jgi:transposase
MLTEDKWMDIKLLQKEGLSIRQIAKQTGLARNTIRRVLRQSKPQPFQSPARTSKLDDFKAYVKQRYETYRLSAVRLLEEIRAQGYTGSIQTLRRFVATLSAPVQAAKELSVRYETPPGQQAQADWAYCGKHPDTTGRLIPIYVFVMVLSFSRMLFVRFTTSMKLPVLIECHQRAFDFFGGWPRTMLYDNMKQVRTHGTQLNPQFVDFTQHYGIIPRTHRPYRPQTKGKVERSVAYVEGNFLRGRSFADLADLNAQGLHWCQTTANVRVHGTTRERPVDLWPKEQLTAVSAIAPYRLVEPIVRKVDREAMVTFGKSRYSVPPEHSGKKVVIESAQGNIVIRCDELIIAEHAQAPIPHSSVVHPDHAAQLWKMSLEQSASPPPPSWNIRFSQEVATRALSSYEEAA